MSRLAAWRWILILSVVATAAVAACRLDGPRVRPRPECPRDSLVIPIDTGGVYLRSERKIVAASGPITDIPEFNDCQRFVSSDGTRFDSMYAIFAAQSLDTLGGSSVPGRPPARVASAAATIYSWGGSYTPLGIKPKFNCLYLWRDDRRSWHAFLRAVGDSDAVCTRPVQFEPGGGSELTVRSTAPQGFADADFPPVARWDWDPRRLVHFIGIKCGAAWCEVSGPAGATPSLTPPSGPLPTVAPEMKLGERRVREIKGWHDYQWIAVAATGPGATPTTLVPRRVYAAVIADPELDRRVLASFDSAWVPVAVVALDDTVSIYETKYNFKQGENQIWIRNTKKGWRARIRAADSTVVERAVIRRDHSAELAAHHLTIPGATRWRWKIEDETVWARCAGGCCEIQDNSF